MKRLLLLLLVGLLCGCDGILLSTKSSGVFHVTPPPTMSTNTSIGESITLTTIQPDNSNEVDSPHPNSSQIESLGEEQLLALFSDEQIELALIEYLHHLIYFETNTDEKHHFEHLTNTTLTIELRDYGQFIYKNSWSKQIIPSILGNVQDSNETITFSYSEDASRVYINELTAGPHSRYIDDPQSTYSVIRSIQVEIPEVSNPFITSKVTEYKQQSLNHFVNGFDHACDSISFEYPETSITFHIGNFLELQKSTYAIGYLSNGLSYLIELMIEPVQGITIIDGEIIPNLNHAISLPIVGFNHINELENDPYFYYLVPIYNKLFVENDTIASYTCPSNDYKK